MVGIKSTYLVFLVGVVPSSAFQSPTKFIDSRSITSFTPPTHYATTNGDYDNDYDNDSENNKEFAAYSGLSNAWGYSRSVVNDRERRRYERRRIRHRLKLEGRVTGKRPPTWAEKLVRMNENIGAGDAFVGNVNKGGSDRDVSVVPPLFDDAEMDEDGYYDMSGVKKRDYLAGLLRQMVRVPYRALFGEYRQVEPGTLILLRHGESLWNANKTFTGWADPDLSPQGYREVEHAARLLLEGGYKVDVVFTSRLKRAIRSTWILLRELNEVYLPVFKSWRLNERNYGALTGLSKTETAERLGAELVQEWRGSLRSRPPALTVADKYYPGRDRHHSDLSPEQIPLTESLLDCMERTKPVWLDKISYEIACGRNVLGKAVCSKICLY